MPGLGEGRTPPLEAIIVIFGRRALIFFFVWKALVKIWKWHHFFAHAQWWSPWRRKNVEKGHLAPSNLTFFYCRVWAVRPVGSLQHYYASVCLSVRSIIAWVSNSSLNGGSTWYPVQNFSSGRGRPLPASWFWFSPCASSFTPLFTRSRSDLLGCGRPFCAGWFESFRLFARAGESSVSGLALFTSLKLCAHYIMYMYILVHAAFQAPCRSAGSFRFLIALIDPAILTQQQSSSSSSNRFIEHDVSTRKLGPSSGIRPNFLNRSIYTFLLHNTRHGFNPTWPQNRTRQLEISRNSLAFFQNNFRRCVATPRQSNKKV